MARKHQPRRGRGGGPAAPAVGPAAAPWPGAPRGASTPALEVYREMARQQHQELAEAQAALEESRDRYASLFDYAPVALLSLRRNGIVEDVNLRGAEMLESTRARILGLPLLAFVARPDHRTFLHHLLLCRRQHHAVSTQLRIRTRQGRVVPVLLSSWTTPSHTRPEYEFRTAITDLSEKEEASRREADYKAKLQSLASELSLAEERERRRIAVGIHDQISQALAMAKMKLDGIRHRNPGPSLRGELDEVVSLVGSVLGHTRSLTFELSPPVLYELGLGAALEWLGERAARQYGLEVSVGEPAPGPALPHETAVLLYQAVRELLVNVGKHARARFAWVRMQQSPRWVRVTVEDDGIGFRHAGQTGGAAGAAAGNGKAPGGKGGLGKDGRGAGVGASAGSRGDGRAEDTGFGLFSIRTRLEHLGGTLEVETRPGGGGRVTMAVPLGPAAASPDGAGRPGPESQATSNLLGPADGREARHESTDRRRPPHRARGTP